ncbi:hypothetical protein BKP45_07015 [Anaerobacillus alkalidiazotrophicus]|uniref:Flagellar biosynthesis protein FlaG n=1 Tax=Anaerobacillus alkalidiazotrophicus TaxID=472963 RepID=A0A1S2MCI4_9BACI|nr:flagellar protein FlaG [Anaerobacillus alkalidiazotrophicus]OIJ22379.1 hypothetical protein BKP45_07015 [Anaerobacillus alkalidiazotrophicus]
MEIGRSYTFSSTSIQQPRMELTNQSDTEHLKDRTEEVPNIKKADVTDVQKKIDGVNQFLKSSNTNLQFNLHEGLKEYYITIVDEDTKEVIKELPPKKLLDFYAAMVESIGLFIDKKI